MFDATYVINLDRTPERWTHAQRVIKAAGFTNVMRFPGIDGAALGDDGIRDLQTRGLLARDLSGFDAGCRDGEIGCAVSHAMVLDEILRCGWQRALILEDDIELAGDPATWRARAAAAMRDLPSSWQLWFLYRCFDIAHRVRRTSPRTVVPWTPQGAAAYGVTASGARLLRDALVPVGTAVDRVYMNVVKRRDIRAFAASPLLVDPGVQPSVINRANPGRQWVEDGVNRPPEYWPEEYLAHLGETPPVPLRARIRSAGARALARLGF